MILFRFGVFGQETFYVTGDNTKDSSTAKNVFTSMSFAGLSPNIGRAVDDRGNTLYAIAGENFFMRAWVQNVPLSGQEKCGNNNDPRPQSGHFIVTVERRLPLFYSMFREKVKILKLRFAESGLSVTLKPAKCDI
jgi:hypothetical protein